MIAVVLDRGRFRQPIEKGLKIMKKKLMKERVLKEFRERQYYVSPGRAAYLARSRKRHMAMQASK